MIIALKVIGVVLGLVVIEAVGVLLGIVVLALLGDKFCQDFLVNIFTKGGG